VHVFFKQRSAKIIGPKVNTATSEEIITLIHEAGFDAVQRTTRYDRLKTYPRADGIARPKEESYRKNVPAVAGSI
jgi:aryl-phospho-beta-D-glucosidase BglC (GH1 family)